MTRQNEKNDVVLAKQQHEKFKINNFRALAIKCVESDESDISRRNEDVTDIFYYELEQHILNGELLNINVNGQVAHGKSTEAMAIMWDVKKLLEQHRKVRRPLRNENVCRDQGEYASLVKARPVELKNECDVIDEWSNMEETGFSSTILDAWLDQFSNTQAQRFYHRIACSPTQITDRNTDILLECVSHQDGRTYNYLRYRLSTGGGFVPVLLGYVIIDVREIMKTAFYKEYRRRKEEKWNLINKYNVQNVREMETAEVILDAFQQLKPLAQYGIISPKYIPSVIKTEADKRGLWFSILHKKDVKEEVEGLLATYQGLLKLSLDYEKAKKEKDEEKKASVKGALKVIEAGFGHTLHRLETLKRLWGEYRKVDLEAKK